VQVVAFSVDQIRVLVPGETTVLGSAVRLTVGAGPTVTVTDCEALPPGPVQVSVNSVVVVSTPVEVEPGVGRAPLQPPLALQVSASVEDHESVDEVLYGTVVGEADRVTLGVGGGLTLTVTLWLALPPSPVQVRV
jgi:hypothetical protein